MARLKARTILLDPKNGSMPIDTGEDSIMVMYGYGKSWGLKPVDVEVHNHEGVDETIYIESGAGYFLHGTAPKTMVKTPWRGPCILFMPAKMYHRVVTTSPGKRKSILTYTRAGAVVPAFDKARVGDRKFTVTLERLKEGTPDSA